MIEFSLEREDNKQRYVLEFHNVKQQLRWFRYLEDEIYRDPRRFNRYMTSLVQDLQVKGGK